MSGNVIYECDAIVFDIDWSLDGTHIAIVGEDSNLVVLRKDPENWTFSEVFRNKRTRTIRRVSWSSDGKRLVTAGFDSIAVVYDVNFDKNPILTERAKLEDQEAELKTARWSHDDNYIVTCSRDKSIYVWATDDYYFTSIHTEHTGDVKDVVFSPDSTRIVSVSYDGTVKIWDPHQEFGSLQTFTEHSGTVWSIAFDSDGDFATAGEDGQVILYEFIDDKFIVSEKIKLQNDALYSISFREGEWLVAGANNTIYIIADNFTDILGKIKTNQLGDINSVKANPANNNIIAAANDDGTVVIVDTSTFENSTA